MKRFIFYFFLFLSFVPRALSEDPIQAKAELSNALITIGDPVEYTVTLKSTDTVQILSSIHPGFPDGLNIKKTEEFQRKEDGKNVEGKRFTLTSFDLGQYVIDPVTIQYRIGGGEVKTLTTNRVYLTVKSVAEGEEKTDIRGIKSVLSMLLRLGPWFLGISVMIAAIAGFMIYRVTRRRGLLRTEEKKLSAEDEALRLLTELYEGDLLRRGKIKEYHFRLSEILRSYLEKRFEILANELTTYEIYRTLKNKAIDPALREKINDVLEAADLAKFAKWNPEPAKIIEMYQKSKQIVEEARPKLPPVLETSHAI